MTAFCMAFNMSYPAVSESDALTKDALAVPVRLSASAKLAAVLGETLEEPRTTFVTYCGVVESRRASSVLRTDVRASSSSRAAPNAVANPSRLEREARDTWRHRDNVVLKFTPIINARARESLCWPYLKRYINRRAAAPTTAALATVTPIPAAVIATCPAH